MPYKSTPNPEHCRYKFVVDIYSSVALTVIPNSVHLSKLKQGLNIMQEHNNVHFCSDR